jgi:hypothetical protein
MSKGLFHHRGHRGHRVSKVSFLCVLCALCGAIWAETKKETVQTPFGPAVRQTKPPAAARTPDASLVKAEVKGDTVTFRRKTPFGDSVWTRQRSELTPWEREILARSK